VPFPGPRPRPRFAGVADPAAAGVSTVSDMGVAVPEGLAEASSKLPSPGRRVSKEK
jgi:hypothetical protein